MDNLVALRRAMCPRCLRAQSTCICAWIVPLATAVEVVILQHRLEVNNAKGSARLLHLGLQNSRMLTGEVFSATQWLPPDDDKCTVLLYPPVRPARDWSHRRHCSRKH